MYYKHKKNLTNTKQVKMNYLILIMNHETKTRTNMKHVK